MAPERALDVGNSTARGLRGNADPAIQVNGSVMRLSPLAIYGHAMEPDALARLARSKSAITHPHPFCLQMGWVWIALQNAFFRLLDSPSLDEGIVDTTRTAATPTPTPRSRARSSAPYTGASRSRRTGREPASADVR